MNDDNLLPPYDNRDTYPLSPHNDFTEAPKRPPNILNSLPNTIQFITSDKSKVFTFQVNPTMVVGRRNSMKDMEVNIDLSDFDAYQLGVSRFHAVIRAENNRLTVEDLDSMNGTRLNNLDLQPSQDYVIENGDKISFGKLSFTIEFMY